MLLSYYAARANLYQVWQHHPSWTHAELAAALGSSKGWVKKWLKRFSEELAAGKPLHDIVQGHSRARHHAPPKTSAVVVEQILQIRDQPPEGLRRTPGPQAIAYYLGRDGTMQLFALPVPSKRTIYRILKAHERIVTPRQTVREPHERPAPMTHWQIDFKDVSSVAPQPDGKRQHVVETLNIIDMGTSVLLAAHVRADFTAETALEALASTLVKYGCPTSITLDRDTRWVGSPHGSDFPSALLRFGACLGIHMHLCDPHHPQQNGFVERYNRTYGEECLVRERPADLAQAQAMTASFVQHYNAERPHQGISCGNRPPLTAFPTLPALPAVKSVVDADGWLKKVDGLHLVRKVNAHGMVTFDLKQYYISSRLKGQYVVLHLDAATRCIQVQNEQVVLKSLPLKGVRGEQLSFEAFLTHMLRQARSQQRLRSLQERRYRTSANASA